MSTFCVLRYECRGQEATWGVIPITEVLSDKTRVFRLGLQILYLTQPFQWPTKLNSTEFF